MGVEFWRQRDQHAAEPHVHLHAVRLLLGRPVTAQSNEQADWSGGTSIIVLNTPPTTAVISYTYDGLYLLKRAAYSSGEVFAYQYDAMGNRMAQTQTLTSTLVTNYIYDAATRPIA